jgi:hypothetical protein
MLINQDIIQLDIDTSGIISELYSLVTSVDWHSNEFDRTEVTLKDGRLCLLPYLISKPTQLVPSLTRDIIIPALNPLIQLLLNSIPNYKIVRGELVNLLPGVSLTEHIDIYWFHKFSRRIHVPLITNLSSELTFEGRPYHLESGKVYEINNRIVHSGYNKGTTDRIHLILDMMPSDVFLNALQTKQNFMEIVQ